MALAFRQQLAVGQIGESQIAAWLRARGYSVLPVYETEINTGKGPRLFTPHGESIAPDMLVMRGTDIRWIEAKHKTVFSWWRIGACWETGIDIRHYEEYLSIDAQHPYPVWLLFLHTSSVPDARDMPYCPPACPIGLFGGRLSRLRTLVSHTSDRHGKSGMVYWKHTDLQLIAALDEVIAAANSGM